MYLRQKIIATLVAATLVCGSARSDDATANDQSMAGWEQSQLLARRLSLSELLAQAENKSYNALCLERKVLQFSSNGRQERFYRICNLVRHVDGVTWIRHFKEFTTPKGGLAYGQEEWIVDGEHILKVWRAGSSTTARYAVSPRGSLWSDLYSRQQRSMLPNKLRSLCWSLQRPHTHFKMDKNGESHAEINMRRRRLGPGDIDKMPPTPGGDIRVFFSSQSPHLPVFSRRFLQLGEDDPFKNSLGIRFFYDRSPDQPTFVSRIVSHSIIEEGDYGTISFDARFERVKFDSTIPRLKIAENMNVWQVEKKGKWTKVPVEEVPREFVDRVEVVSDQESGVTSQEYPKEFTAVRDRLESLPVPPFEDLPPMDGEYHPPEDLGTIPDQEDHSGSTQQRYLLLGAGISLLIVGVVLFVVFVIARLEKTKVSSKLERA